MTYIRVKITRPVKVYSHGYANLTCAYEKCGKQFVVLQGLADRGRRYCSVLCFRKDKGFKIIKE